LRLDAIYQVLAECKVFISIGTSGSVDRPASLSKSPPRRRPHGRAQLEPSQSATLFAERNLWPGSKIVAEFVASLLKGQNVRIFKQRQFRFAPSVWS